jgi:hypothetical protein
MKSDSKPRKSAKAQKAADRRRVRLSAMEAAKDAAMDEKFHPDLRAYYASLALYLDRRYG